MDKLEEALDKNIKLTEALESKLTDFIGYLKGITIGMSIIALIQFTTILWLIFK